MASVAKRKWTYKGREKEAWVVRYVDKGGAHRSRQFEKKKDADTHARHVENELEAGTHVARSTSLTVEKVIEEYLALMNRRLSDGSISRSYFERINLGLKYPRETLASVKLTDLTWQQVYAAAEQWRVRVQANTGAPMAHSSLNYNFWLFSHLIEWAMRRGYCAKNPAKQARKEWGAIPTTAIDTFAREEIQALFRALESRAWKHQKLTHDRMRATVYLGALCGLRIGEIFALEWSAIDWNNRLIHVRQSMDRKGNIRPPKTESGRRSVPMPAPIAAALDLIPRAGTLIFRTSEGGNPFGGSTFYGKWWALLDRAGIAKGESGYRHFHALRHFAGSLWLEQGASLAEVSQLLGHANTAVTAKVYSHALKSNELQQPLVERCAQGLLPAPIAQEVRKAA